MKNKKIFVSIFERSWGTVYELFSISGKFTVAIEIIPPGKMIQKHYHKLTKEIEIVLDGIPLVNGKNSSVGNVFVWNPHEIHEYNNLNGDKEAIILTISMPDFDVNDEIFI
jgi:hypothetical protein